MVETPASSLIHLEWARVCEQLFVRVASPAARDRSCDAEGQPIADAILPRTTAIAEVHERLERLRGLELCLERARVLELGISLSGELGQVEDCATLLARAARGSLLDVGELAVVADAAIAAGRVTQMIEAVAEGGLDPRASEADVQAFGSFHGAMAELGPPRELTSRLARSLDRTSDEPRLADAASPALASLRARAATSRRTLVAAAERLLRRTGMEKALADRYWTERDGRVVLPVRSDAFSRAGGGGTVAGIIHGASGSGQTLFVEPHELVDVANERREATMAVEAEEQRILAALSREVGEAAPALERSLARLVELDGLHARLRLCTDLQAVEPRVHAADSIHAASETERVHAAAAGHTGARLPQARHPLMVLRGTAVVPNDLVLAVGQALVISGPNAGGKTVALKTLGLFALMVQAGLRLPTQEPADVPLYRCIVTDVGDDQSIAANLSTFSAHIGHVIDALEAAEHDGPGVLVLLDEVAVGTDPDQGSALAEAILQALVERGASVVVTTHYERLKLLATTDPVRFANAAVGFDLEALRPTFRLRLGAPGSSSALAVARRLGLPASVLALAESLQTSARLRVDALLQDIEAERERLHVEAERLAEERRRLEEERAILDLREQRAEDTAAERRRKAHAAAATQLRALEDEIKQRRKALRHSTIATDDAGVSDPSERSFARDARARLDADRPVAAESPAAPVPDVTVGARVHVTSLGLEGHVLAIKGEKVTVQLPLAKTTVPLQEIALPTSKAKRVSPAPRAAVPERSFASRHFGHDAEPVRLGIDNVVDLRGVRAEEALTMVEVFLDRAITEDREIVVVRHGHGSGALRKAVREHLPELRHVRNHRPGLPAEGGDAVTVVWVHA